MSTPYILSIDQGTTSSRAILFDTNSNVIASEQLEFDQIFPADGWVEHDPEQIWNTTRQCIGKVLMGTGDTYVITAGITNQRETTIIWDRATGKPVYNAIVWQDRRTTGICKSLKQDGLEPIISGKTGLRLDPYFSATKIAWMLDHVEGARKKAEKGQLAFGTVDSFLMWRLTGGKSHLTDATNASRTLLFNIHTGEWDQQLLEIFNIPVSLLPEVKNCADTFGEIDRALFSVKPPIQGVAGDQQAALFGQACFSPGMVKSTYGTGCFMVMNTADSPVKSSNNLLTTIGYQLNNQTTYALEGSIFNAGTAIQWLRDELELFGNNQEIDALIQSAENRDNDDIYFVPAFTGLGTPYWHPDARGIISGITRDTNKADLLRSALNSVCYQSHDLVSAMARDSHHTLSEIRVDGGMTVNTWLLQRLADITDTHVVKPVITETTALGASYLAGLGANLYQSLEDIQSNWQLDRQHYPSLDVKNREDLLEGWQKSIERCLL